MTPLLQDDEFVVFSPEQVRLKYVVRFSVKGDQLKDFSPDVSTLDERLPSPAVHGENCRTIISFYLPLMKRFSPNCNIKRVSACVQSCVQRARRR